MTSTDHPLSVRGPVARLYHQHPPAELLISGPRGTGKDVGIGLYLRWVCEEYQRARILVTRKTRRSLTESWMVTWEDQVLTAGDVMLGGASRNNRHSYDHPNGSTVVLGGMDEPMRMYSTEWDIVYVQEANELSLDEWERLGATLRHHVVPWQQLLGSCNPGAPSSWLYQRALAGKMAHWVTRHTHNPAYYTADGKLTDNGRAYLSILARLTGTRRKRLYDGLWVASEGQVYDTWNRDTHVKARAGPWRRIVVGVDDGYTHPFCALRVGIDGDGRAHVISEHYQTRMNGPAKVEAVRALCDGAERVIVDSAAATLIADLREAGIPADGVVKRTAVADADGKEKSWLLASINKVQARLAVAGDDLPRLTVDPFCVNTAAEFEAYERRQVDGVYQEAPEDEDNHAMDALRYVVDTIDDDGAEFAVSVVGKRPMMPKIEAEVQAEIAEANIERLNRMSAFLRGD